MNKRPGSVPELGVVVGCDSDPDRPRYGGTRYDSREPMRWRGLTEGVRRAREIGDEFLDDFGNPLRITWCIRSDEQIAGIYGDPAWSYGQFGEIWQQMREAGDELAWHPHLWRWAEHDGCWYQETEDAAWIEDCLDEGYGALADRMGDAPRTSRMGWEFHNNASMNTLRKLPVEVDMTAIPGRFIAGGPDRDGSVFARHLDWRGAPEEAYVPKTSDYRKPARPGEENGLVELPMSVFRSPSLSAVAALRRLPRQPVAQSVTELTHLAQPLKAYITSNPYVFGRLAAGQMARAQRQRHGLLVTAFHPDELLSGYGDAGNSAANFRTNLQRLRRMAQQKGVRLRFMNAREALDTIDTASAAKERVA